MARELELLDVVDYVPEAFDNRTDPEPIVVKCRYMTAKKFRRYQNQLKLKQKKGVFDITNKDEINRKMLAESVLEVSNYSLGGAAITDGGALFDHGEQDLIDEMLDAMVDLQRLNEGQLKNFGGLSDS